MAKTKGEMEGVSVAKRRVVIVLAGGLVQDVLSNEPIDYCVIDYDVEDADADRLTKIPQCNGRPAEDAYAFAGKTDVMPERVLELFGAIWNRIECNCVSGSAGCPVHDPVVTVTVAGVTDDELNGPVVVCEEHIDVRNDDCHTCDVEWAQQTKNVSPTRLEH